MSHGGALLTRLLPLACVVALGALPGLACAAPAQEGKRPGTTTHDAMRPGGTIDLRWMPATVTRWSPQMTAAAARHGLDPELLAIMTFIESKGNPDAEGPSGALGLLQIMPATGAKIAATRKISDFSPEKLKDPDYNLDFGAWYLARQVEAFGDVVLAATAYNCGPGTVRRHLTKGTPLSAGVRRYQARFEDLWERRHAR